MIFNTNIEIVGKGSYNQLTGVQADGVTKTVKAYVESMNKTVITNGKSIQAQYRIYIDSRNEIKLKDLIRYKGDELTVLMVNTYESTALPNYKEIYV